MRIAVKVVMAVALAASGFGVLGWTMYDTTPRCDGQEMRPGQQCFTFGGPGGGTYEQVKERNQESKRLGQQIAVGGALVFAACGVGLYATRERRR